jgi:replicative DNA helicase
MLVGPDGTGKTSLGEQLALAMIEVHQSSLLGYNVEPVGRVLYLACDRPSQARRSMRRMVTEDDRAQLDERLMVWEGPLPFDLGSEPGGLLAMARYYRCDALFVDSVKDGAADLSREETGLGINRAFQECVTEGIEVAALHHQRKQQNGAGKPNRLSDVYGSRWIVAGCGSVVMLWGEAGDPVVELTHLKQPDQTVGPLQLVHDHEHGRTTVLERVDALTLIEDASSGMTAEAIAEHLFGSAEPNNIRKARRQIDALVKAGRVHRQDGARGGASGREAATYYPVSLLHPGGGSCED